MSSPFQDLYNSFVKEDKKPAVSAKTPEIEVKSNNDPWSEIASVLKEHNIPTIQESKPESMPFNIIPTPTVTLVEEVVEQYTPTDFEPIAKDAELISRVLELEKQLNDSKLIIEEQRAILERDRIKDQIKDLEDKLSKLDDTASIFSENIDEHKQALLEHVDEHVGSLIDEKASANISADVRKYIDSKLTGLTNEIHRQMRIMVDYVGGGGSNAVQLAAGGTINGNLNVTGQYLSGGVTLVSVITSLPSNEYVQTLNTPASSTNNFLVFNTGGVNYAVQTWKY
jgi:uncharacterized protein YaaR (DUF327 family)